MLLAVDADLRHARGGGDARDDLGVEDFLEVLAAYSNVHARAFLLEQHRNARIALAPTAVQSLRHFGERDVRELHRSVSLAAERGCERDVLMGELQREARMIELAREELVG